MARDYKAILATITTEQWEAIATMATVKAHENTTNQKVELLDKRVSDILGLIGLPPNLIGYRYLKRAIIMTYEDYTCVQLITKKLYPVVASEYATTSTRVERAIRHSIEVAFKRGDYNLLSKMVSWNPQKRKPTNSEFVASISEYIRNS